MQEQSSSGGKTSYKLYVEVGVVYAPDGVMEPKYLRLSPTGKVHDRPDLPPSEVSEPQGGRLRDLLFREGQGAGRKAVL